MGTTPKIQSKHHRYICIVPMDRERHITVIERTGLFYRPFMEMVNISYITWSFLKTDMPN